MSANPRWTAIMEGQATLRSAMERLSELGQKATLTEEQEEELQAILDAAAILGKGRSDRRSKSRGRPASRDLR